MRFIIASLVLLISAGSAVSQTQKIHFRTLSLSRANFADLWTVTSGKAVPLKFSSSQPSATLTADKGGPLKIFKGPLDDKGNPTDAAPSLVELPASSSILLLGWMENDKPVFLAVPDAFDTAKSEDWLVVNTSKTPLTVQIGEKAKPMPVGANSQQMLRSAVPLGEGAAVIVSAKQADASWKNVYSSYLPTFAGSRGLLVVVQKGERLNVNYIADKIAAK